MTNEEMIRKFKQFLDNQTGQEMERRLLRVASDLKDNVRDRVQASGTNADNRPFAPYTIPYAKTRLKKGFQARKVDYTRTGRLFGSITPRLVSNDGQTIVIEIGPRGRENELKLLGPGALASRKDGVSRGLITLPNQQEVNEAFEDMINEIIEDFENTFR